MYCLLPSNQSGVQAGEGGDFFGVPGERELPRCVMTKGKEALPEQTAGQASEVRKVKKTDSEFSRDVRDVRVHAASGPFKGGYRFVNSNSQHFKDAKQRQEDCSEFNQGLSGLHSRLKSIWTS